MFLLSNLRELSKKLKKAKTKCLFSNKLLRIGGIKYIQKIKYILEWNLLEKSAKRPFVVLFPYCRCASHIYAI